MNEMSRSRRKKRRRKQLFVRVLFVTIIVAGIVCAKDKLSEPKGNYKCVKDNINVNYSGVGQDTVGGEDGYSTTFTTDGEKVKTYIEYKQNGAASWAENKYWGGTMADNGCGITAMAIVLSGYEKNVTPEDLRKKYAPVLDYGKMTGELSRGYGIQNSDFYYDSVHLSKEKIEEHLLTGRPIIVCVWKKPTENRWTTASHYMVLLAADGKGKVYVSNPNGEKEKESGSGWYKTEEVTKYLAKAMYIESY